MKQEEVEKEIKPNVEFWVEKVTSFIVQAQGIGDIYLVKNSLGQLQKFSTSDFFDRYEEFSGDREVVRQWLEEGVPTAFTVSYWW